MELVLTGLNWEICLAYLDDFEASLDLPRIIEGSFIIYLQKLQHPSTASSVRIASFNGRSIAKQLSRLYKINLPPPQFWHIQGLESPSHLTQMQAIAE